MKKYFLIILPVLFFTACDCYQHIEAVVLDKNTHLPLDSVYAKNVARDDARYTDTNGGFELSAISGGFRSCPPMVIELSKPGYQAITYKTHDSPTDTIYLEKK